MSNLIIKKTVSSNDVIADICQHVPPEFRAKIIESIERHFAGCQVYFPARCLNTYRNREVLRQFFDGVPKKVICQNFDISGRHFYRIVKAHYKNKKNDTTPLENVTADMEDC